MDRFRAQLDKCMQIVDTICNIINQQHIPSNNINCNDLYNALYQLIPLIPD